MMLPNFKKLLLSIACLPVVFCINADTETKKLQILSNPADPSFNFLLNTGTGIVTNPGAMRPAGSYFLANALVFPKGTISKKQTSYLVDKHGHTLTAHKSIGSVQFYETMVQDLDFNNFPTKGTFLEVSQWSIHFNHECDKEVNNIYAIGSGYAGEVDPGSALFKFILGMVGGTGCNAKDNSISAKAYLAPDGMSSLIKVKFEKEIKYD